jgi:hypothetical protein
MYIYICMYTYIYISCLFYFEISSQFHRMIIFFLTDQIHSKIWLCPWTKSIPQDIIPVFEFIEAFSSPPEGLIHIKIPILRMFMRLLFHPVCVCVYIYIHMTSQISETKNHFYLETADVVTPPLYILHWNRLLRRAVNRPDTIADSVGRIPQPMPCRSLPHQRCASRCFWVFLLCFSLFFVVSTGGWDFCQFCSLLLPFLGELWGPNPLPFPL